MNNPPFSQVDVGKTGQATIASSDTPQPLVDEQLLVKSVQAVPADDAAGTVKFSYGGTPILPQLALAAQPGKWIDLNQVFIQSTSSGDKVNYNYIANY